MPLGRGEAAGDKTDRRRLDVTFDAGDLTGEAHARIGLEAKRGVQQLWAVEESVAMQPA